MFATTYSPYQLCPGFCPGEDTPASPHIKTMNAEKLRLSIPNKVYRNVARRSTLGNIVDSLCFVHAAIGFGTTSAV